MRQWYFKKASLDRLEQRNTGLYKYSSPYSTDLEVCQQIRHPPPLKITLNYIWWWGSSPEASRNMEYLFIVFILMFTLTRSGRTW